MNGAVFAAQKVAGVGVLIRDAKGRVVGACSKKIMAPLGAVETKAKAFDFGLQFTRDLLIHDFFFFFETETRISLIQKLNYNRTQTTRREKPT